MEALVDRLDAACRNGCPKDRMGTGDDPTDRLDSTARAGDACDDPTDHLGAPWEAGGVDGPPGCRRESCTR